jgi:hypothetical protein
MSNFRDFIHSRTLRHPTTWLVAATGAIYGGLQMVGVREAKRAAGAEIQLPWLWLERLVDFLMGAGVQLAFLFAAIWLVAGLMEQANVWVRQITVVVLYVGSIWLSQYL